MAHERQKYAHARGACIEWLNSSGQWCVVRDPSWAPGNEYRVAEYDQHLDYGPLSTALREIATTLGDWTVWHNAAHRVFTEFEPTGVLQGQAMDSNTRKMQMLTLAEFLADEGL